MHQLELELCGPADQLNGPLRIIEAGQLHHDTLCALFADIGLTHPKRINPITNFFEDLIDSTVANSP